jgi:hypothetical protein
MQRFMYFAILVLVRVDCGNSVLVGDGWDWNTHLKDLGFVYGLTIHSCMG